MEGRLKSFLNQASDFPSMTAVPGMPAAMGPAGCSVTARQRTRPSMRCADQVNAVAGDSEDLAVGIGAEYAVGIVGG